MQELNNKIKIIGKGSFSCVLYPSINSNNNLSMVGKIGTSEDLSMEYYRIKKLPENGPYLYYNVKTFDLTKEQSSDIIDIANLKINKGFKLMELIIPLIHGESLEEFLNKYKESPFFNKSSNIYQYIDENNLKPDIKFNQWFNLINAFGDFYDKVKEMNLEYSVFHNDIHLGNIMYDDYKLYLIDWAPPSGFGNFDEYGRDIIDESDEYNEEIEYNEYDYKQGEDDRDAETVISIIKTIIEIGIYNNDEIASYCLSNSIIDSYPVLSKESYNNCRSNVKILDYKLLFSKLK